jgi:hypothetical protein
LALPHDNINNINTGEFIPLIKEVDDTTDPELMKLLRGGG